MNRLPVILLTREDFLQISAYVSLFQGLWT
ncbi:MAG: hypothetical protein BWX73_03052 [Lentisphaerae bacterium ADurb.Bin082]|nr:MAG: hypothetical protein BWX73_03052 [Lentisphaerae bacterium ADurb.Bin082]